MAKEDKEFYDNVVVAYVSPVTWLLTSEIDAYLKHQTESFLLATNHLPPGGHRTDGQVALSIRLGIDREVARKRLGLEPE